MLILFTFLFLNTNEKIIKTVANQISHMLDHSEDMMHANFGFTSMWGQELVVDSISVL